MPGAIVMASSTFASSLVLACQIWTGFAAVYTVPSSPPSNASPQLDPNPFGLSIEFAAFPAFMNNATISVPCIQQISDVMGIDIPIRIGGSSQDRGTYDATLKTAASASADVQKSSFTFGSSFMSLAATLKGNVTIGFNRKENNLQNTIAAAKVAKAVMANLYAIELGNEPDGFSKSPVATASGGWSATIDAANERSWQASVCTALGTTDLIQAGAFASITGDDIAELAPAEGTSLKYVKSFSGHRYAQTACDGKTTNLQQLMSHSVVNGFMPQFKKEISAANAVGKPYFIGETNSVSCEGGGISPMFGAALWLIDYTLQGLITGAHRLYFHQAAWSICKYCFWTANDLASPFYGAYFVGEALSGATRVAMLDAGNTAYATYIIYNGNKPARAVLYNSDYYTGGTRSTQSFTLSGLTSSSVTAKRLTAPNAETVVGQGTSPSYGGQTFQSGTCAISSNATKVETTAVSGGKATFSVGASEALLVFL